MTTAFRAFLIALAFLLASCGGGVNTTPVGHTGPTSPATTLPAGSMSVTAVNAALTNVQALYAGMPHSNSATDLPALAQAMVKSGQFTQAQVTSGGISATLPDGSLALVFADHLGDTTAANVLQSSRSTLAESHPAAFLPVQDSVAILVNNSDKSGAFNPAVQTVIGSAVGTALFEGSNYGIDVGDVQLDTIASISTGGSNDLLDIATHGMVAMNATGSPIYAMLSDTPITSAALTEYGSDFAAGNIMYAVTLSSGLAGYATFAFTPAFITGHVHFRPGAILINNSCDGQNAAIAASVAATLKAGGVGRYIGWTQPVLGSYADETDGFIYDRLIGENPINTALSQLVTQRTPAQRAFPLDNVLAAAATETRAGPTLTSTLNYATSAAAAGYQQAQLASTDLGGEALSNPPILYGLPSIEYLAVSEGATGGTLTIYGHFPPQTGSVFVNDPSSANEAAPITPTQWATDHVTVPIPVSGTGSKGVVTVTSADGVLSNSVNLTQWSGTLSSTETATINGMGGRAGAGSGTIAGSYTIDFRSDVHPTVPAVDQSPVPQNLTFTAPEYDSGAQITSITGFFQTGDGLYSATFGAVPTGGLTVGPPPFAAGTFDLGAVAGQPASCNSSVAGPQTGNTNVFCPEFGYSAPSVGTCSDTGGSLCFSPLWNVKAVFGTPSIAGSGLLIFTLNPTTYAITVSSVPAQTTTQTALFEATAFPVPLVGAIQGTMNAPVSPPQPGQFPSSEQRATMATAIATYRRSHPTSR